MPDDEQTQPAVFPDREIRDAFPHFNDQKTIQQAWSGMTPADQARFVEAARDGDPAGVAGRVAVFLDSAPGPQADTARPGPSPAADGTPGSTAPGNGDSTGPTPDEQRNAGDPELEEALGTIETAEAYAAEHPDRLDDLLAAEQARETPRKTLVEFLERAQRRRDREAREDQSGE